MGAECQSRNMVTGRFSPKSMEKEKLPGPKYLGLALGGFSSCNDS